METFTKARTGTLQLGALEFIGADIEPDKGMYLAKWNSYIMALKAYSCQFYYDAANATGSILSPAENMAFRVGCASADSVKEVAGPWRGGGRPRTGKGDPSIPDDAPGSAGHFTPSVDRVLTHDDLASRQVVGCQDRRTCPVWDHPRFLWGDAGL